MAPSHQECDYHSQSAHKIIIYHYVTVQKIAHLALCLQPPTQVLYFSFLLQVLTRETQTRQCATTTHTLLLTCQWSAGPFVTSQVVNLFSAQKNKTNFVNSIRFCVKWAFKYFYLGQYPLCPVDGCALSLRSWKLWTAETGRRFTQVWPAYALIQVVLFALFRLSYSWYLLHSAMFLCICTL